MLTAIRQSDKNKIIGNDILKDKTEIYNCDFCGQIVIHHKSESKIKIGHFKHKNRESICPSSRETLEHIKIKQDIHDYIKGNFGNSLNHIEPEKWLFNKTMRPDIYIETKHGNKIAIEVQASILSITEIINRTKRYYDKGIYVLWVIKYDNNRFYYYRSDTYHKEDGSLGIDRGYFLKNKIRLKEFEIYLYWAYFKKLIMWDLSQKYSYSFIIAELTEYNSASIEYYKDGENHFHYGRKAKVLKSIENIKKDIPFKKFKPCFAKEYKIYNRDYKIPERLILSLEIKQKKETERNLYFP